MCITQHHFVCIACKRNVTRKNGKPKLRYTASDLALCHCMKTESDNEKEWQKCITLHQIIGHFIAFKWWIEAVNDRRKDLVHSISSYAVALNINWAGRWIMEGQRCVTLHQFMRFLTASKRRLIMKNRKARVHCRASVQVLLLYMQKVCYITE